MNKIITSLSTNNVVYGAFAVAAVAVMVFAVIPQFPQVGSTLDKVTVAATAVFAQDSGCCDSSSGGGDGDGGGFTICELYPNDPRCTPTIPTPKVPSCDFFTATPKTLPHGGGNVTLAWGTTNATSVFINNGVGAVPVDGSTTVSVNATITYVLTASVPGLFAGNSQSVTCSETITVQPPVAKPAKCDSFSVNPRTLPHGGGNVTLAWETTNATSVSINGGIGSVSVDGSKTVFVDRTITYTLTAIGTGGNANCTATVTVQPPVAKPAKCDSFSANRTSVPHGGGNVVLTWNTTNATAVSINQGIGSVPVDGSTTVFVNTAKTFTLTAIGAGGNATCTETITVSAPSAPICDFLSASKTQLPEQGGHVTLSWGTTNVTSASINNGIGSVPVDGSETVFVDDTTTFVLTASGAGGSTSCHVTVHVADKQLIPRCDFFTVSDDDVEEGDRVTLSWGTTNATSVFINNGVGSVSADGSEDVRVYDDITYTLTAQRGNKEDTCSVRIEVEEEKDDDDDPRPRCELDISDNKVKRGDKVTLEWETRYADEVEIEDDRGNRIFRDRNLSRNDDGDVDVRITRDTEFTLTAKGDGGKRECEVDVEVEDEASIVITEREIPRVAGISLTQVPYTGFEAGPTLTFLFYALLAVWAFVVAYMLVIRKDTILGFSLAGRSNGVIHEDRVVATPIMQSVAAPVADTPANLPVGNPTVGYSSLYTTETEEVEETNEVDDGLTAIEEHAHARRVLLSSDALRYVAQHLVAENGIAALDLLIDTAKASFPTEDGWMVLNLARVEELLQTDVSVQSSETLAHAIVNGDIVAAYKLIADRPMVTLAGAATELDMVYRTRLGQNASADVSLNDALATQSTETLKAAIDALTSALDGTYTDEQEAVKMAVMKAINVFVR